MITNLGRWVAVSAAINVPVRWDEDVIQLTILSRKWIVQLVFIELALVD